MLYRVLTVAAVGLMMTTGAQAGLTFDTVTAGSPVGYSGAGTDGSGIMAASFALAGTLNFNSVSLLLSADNPSDLGSALVYLVPDDGSNPVMGAPGSPDWANAFPIGSIADSSLTDISDPSAPALVTLAGFSNPFASSNGQYWIALDTSTSSSSAEWAFNADGSGVGTTGQMSYSDFNGQYLDDGTTGQGAFAMIVDAPEPATIAVLGAGLAGLGFFRRRNAKKA